MMITSTSSLVNKRSSKHQAPVSHGAPSVHWGCMLCDAEPELGFPDRSAPSIPRERHPQVPAQDPPVQNPDDWNSLCGMTLEKQGAGLAKRNNVLADPSKQETFCDTNALQRFFTVSTTVPYHSINRALHLCLMGEPNPASLSAESAGEVAVS